MPGGYLHGWNPDAEEWVKVVCNPDGELDIDATAIFENPPIEDETGKGPSSEWAFDHKADAGAHHDKYTDANSRAAINNIINSSGEVINHLELSYKTIQHLTEFQMQWDAEDDYSLVFKSSDNSPSLRVAAYHRVSGVVNTVFYIYYNGVYRAVIHSGSFRYILDDYLEENPTDGINWKAPTSNWAYDHENDASIHFAKFTQLEAREACNLDGDLYLSLPGNGFLAEFPDTDDIQRTASGYTVVTTGPVNLVTPVSLPDGATITEVIVYGNAGAESQTWRIRRFAIAGGSTNTMATAVVNTADNTITYPEVDNSAYSYFIDVAALATNDWIYGARIKYTISP